MTCRIRFMRPLAHCVRGADENSRSRRPAAGLDARYRNRHLRRRRNEDGQVDDAVLSGANQLFPIDDQHGSALRLATSRSGTPLLRDFRDTIPRARSRSTNVEYLRSTSAPLCFSKGIIAQA